MLYHVYNQTFTPSPETRKMSPWPGPLGSSDTWTGRSVSLFTTLGSPKYLAWGGLPMTVAHWCAQRWEEATEVSSPCQPARINSIVWKCPWKRCLLSPKSVVLSALLQLIYSWETPNNSLKNPENTSTAKEGGFFWWCFFFFFFKQVFHL